MTQTTRFIEENRTPWVTYMLLAVMASVFLLEYYYAVTVPTSFTASTATLLALGGDNRYLVASGDYYRLFTAVFLHANFFHILGNAVALYFAGIFLERLVGPAWFFSIFTAGALGGSLLSLALNTHAAVAVGASGAIMALFSAMYVCSFRLPPGPQRRLLQSEAIRILIPALLPLAQGSHSVTDVSAHIGGTLAGIIMGMVLLAYWPDRERWPELRALAKITAVAGLALFVLSFGAAVESYPGYKILLTGLMPESEIAQNIQENLDWSSELIKRYPKDPRAHNIRAIAMFTHHDTAGSKRELTTTLALESKISFMFGARFENNAHTLLALIALGDNQRDEARQQLKPVCHAPPQDRPDKLFDLAQSKGLCS